MRPAKALAKPLRREIEQSEQERARLREENAQLRRERERLRRENERLTPELSYNSIDCCDRAIFRL